MLPVSEKYYLLNQFHNNCKLAAPTRVSAWERIFKISVISKKELYCSKLGKQITLNCYNLLLNNQLN